MDLEAILRWKYVSHLVVNDVEMIRQQDAYDGDLAAFLPWLNPKTCMNIKIIVQIHWICILFKMRFTLGFVFFSFKLSKADANIQYWDKRKLNSSMSSIQRNILASIKFIAIRTENDNSLEQLVVWWNFLFFETKLFMSMTFVQKFICMIIFNSRI